MYIETKRLIIRDLDFKDKKNLFKIVWQKDVVRFMKDWSEDNPHPESFHNYINWHQKQNDSTDVYQNKRYAVTLKESDELIGMVGMGLEDTLNEVEMAYFIDEEYQGRGYATEALGGLFEWCMNVSDIPYMILTIDCANTASCKVALKSGFELFEKRTPISHKQPNMESDSYYYYRRYRENPFNKEGKTMENIKNVFIQIVEKPMRKVIIKRGIRANDYFTYCEEIGCDVLGLLTSISSISGEPVCLWLPKEYIKPGTSTYVQGVEVPIEYDGVIPEGFDIIELPSSKYLMFQGEPFLEEDYGVAIGQVWNAIEKYNPSIIGYSWDEAIPRVQLEPIGRRGYIELVPIK